MKALRYALRALPRDLRLREMRVLAAALAIAVGALTAVGFFTDRIEQGMAARAADLLGADLVLESSRALPPAWIEQAEATGLRTARTLSFPSVLVVGERDELVSVKAVEPGYPLRGRVGLADERHGTEQRMTAVPERGQAWLDPRLFSQLELVVGDRVPVGDRRMTVAAVLTHEPDRAGGLFQLAPRVMIHYADLDATGLLGPGSRVTHRLLVAGTAGDLAAFRDWLAPRLDGDVRVRDLDDARPEMRETLNRASAFLGLAAMMAVLLAGAAIAITVHAFSRREADGSALMRCFGAPQRLVVTALLARLLVIGLLASAAGIGIGWLAQAGLVNLVGHWFLGELPAAGLRPVFTGLLAGMITLVGFGLVPALRIRRVPVIRVLRQEQSAPEPSAVALGAAAIAAMAVLLWHEAGDPRLALAVLAGMLGMLVLLAGASWLMIRAMGRIRAGGLSPWRFGLANLDRRARGSTVQTVGFGLGLLALFLLAVVRVEILDAWQREIPADVPNQFMVNIQPADVDRLRQRLDDAGIATSTFYPMIRGRLIEIDGRRVSPDDYAQARTRRLVDREFNMTWMRELPADNRVTAGHWWSDNGAGRSGWSVETGIAERLDLAVGDELTFRVAGRRVSGVIANLREVDWETFQPNFFVISAPELLGAMDATWMTAYRVPDGAEDDLRMILREFPAVTVLDVEAIIRQVREVIDQGARAIEYVFLFTLVAGVIVLLAAVGSSQGERRSEIALLRTLGASGRTIRLIQVAEFGLLGAIAGLIAALGAIVTGWAVSVHILELPYQVNAWLPLAGVLAGGVGVALAGLAASRRLIAEPPLAVLRGA